MRVVYTEYGTVEKPILDWLQELGWEYVPPESLDRNLDEAFDLTKLKHALKTLNPEVLKTNEDVNKVIERLQLLPNDIRGNREFFDWLKSEASIILRQDEKHQTIRLIDYENLQNNRFIVTNQFPFAGYENIRPDVVLMVNGIPLTIIEAKAQAYETVDYTDAISQLLRYNREAPQLFKYLAFVCATDGAIFRYDWTTPGRYFQWKNSEGDPLEASVKGLFQRDRFLDLIQNFIVFETAHEQITKKIAMQQQYEAANKIIHRILNEPIDRGLIWHTQGSGKTLTMLYTAWKLKRQPQLQNPTIIVVVDRLELQRQFRETFTNVDLPYTTWAITARDLLNKIRRGSREVIITTIQKFKPVDRPLDERDNIIILIDEAHRSQYGDLAIRMRAAFPNAKIFGFTGTPIDKGPTGRSTFRTFCPPKETYLDRYSIKESIEDGSTVRIIYQPRLPELHIPKEDLDRDFLLITEDLKEEDQEKVLQKSARLKTILKARDRIEKIARDIAKHYQSSIEPNGFKAQLVAIDREACALYKEELDKHLPPEYSTVIYTSGQNDDDLLRKYHMPKDDQLKIARQDFQKPETMPYILVVTDMLLTGFDAPIEQAMYLDKPLRDHKLLQAIARTNRPYPNKEAGIIIDYIGIFENLKEALNFEVEDIEGVADSFDILKKEFVEHLERLRELFGGIVKEDTRESLFRTIEVVEDEKNRSVFRESLFRAKRIFETIAPDPDLTSFLDDYAWFIKINEAYNKLYSRKAGDLRAYQEKTQGLIREKLILQKLDETMPSFEIGPEYLKKLEVSGYTEEEKVAELRGALSFHIRINLESNPVYESLSQRLERILKQKDTKRMRRELEAIVEELNQLDRQIAEKGLTKEEHALLTATQQKFKDHPEDELKPFVKQILAEIKGEDGKQLFRGWQNQTQYVKEVKQRVFKCCFSKFKDKHPPKEIMALTDDLMRFITRYNP
jgi:type I restriction enzyme R subunit